jgi:hypothetical protein
MSHRAAELLVNQAALGAEQQLSLLVLKKFCVIEGKLLFLPIAVTTSPFASGVFRCNQAGGIL